MSKKLSRRELLGLGAGIALGGSTAVREVLAQATSTLPAQPVAPALATAPAASASPALPMRVLGQTGQKVTVFGLGGASSKTPLSNGPHEAAVAIVERALNLGVNYFDSATTYGNGKSERAIGEVAKSRRKEMFIASKTDLRDYDGAMRELEESLKRLQTDHLDVWQMHRASLPERDTEPFFGTNGAMKALQKAKDEKMVRFVGVSGHHRSDVLADWLQRYPFDTLLASINAADVHQEDSFIKRLLPVAQQKKVGVIAMKVPAYGRLINPEAGVTIRDAMHYSLSQAGVACCIIACDTITQLEENVATARTIDGPMEAAAQTALEAKTADYWQRASFYRRWT
ncbi:MAG TPA: aldo/keto reductase [Abditibacteriaceae bacterium]|jgi:predicted aldo/keto reductase-like oxidoreductase